MNEKRLERDILYMVKEQQIKLGYMRGTVRLYYPLQSLCRLLEEECTAEAMLERLNAFCESVKEKGEIAVSCNKRTGRFCFHISPELSEYVHENSPQKGFLYDLIGLLGGHVHSIEKIYAVFRAYSDRVIVQEIDGGEFDYMICFEDGEPDDSCFCFTAEGDHITYHRFSREDYKQISGTEEE